MLGEILFNASRWWVPALLLWVLSALFLAWAYQRLPLSFGAKCACVLLKLLGLAALALCLLEPLWMTERAKPGANYFLVMADNSLSLSVHDQGSAQSRGESMKQRLISQGKDWQTLLAKDFQVRDYIFDSRLQRVENFSVLNFDGKSTAFGSALRSVQDRFSGQPLAGILLFSDGNFTDLPTGWTDTNQIPPLFPVVVGGDVPSRDIALTSVAASQTAFEDAPVTVQSDVAAYGYGGRKLVGQLLDLSGKVLQEQSEVAKGDDAKLAFRFQFKPEKAGLGYYRVRVAAADELTQFSNPAELKEATLVNNSRVFVVDRGQDPFRVLYVSGRPNWEFKFMNRALADDSQVQLVGLIRIARREPKFEFRGRNGESSNPLFRGFGNQDKEEIERYDQPVLVRLNTRDQAELQGGFPKLPEDLFAYHAIILDDVEADFFTPEQMQLIQRFVSVRGGGLLMLGGQESFQQGKYQRTVIGDLLPVYLDAAAGGRPATNGLKLTLTREGLLQPWARLRSQETDERSRLDQMPTFHVLNRVRDFKPGATVVATVTDPAGSVFPAIVTQRFGNGRTGAVMIGDLWRWGLKDEERHKDLDKAWRQLVRWLVSDVPRRIDVQAQPIPGDANEAVSIQVRAKSKDFTALDNATVSIRVSRPSASGTNQDEVKLVAEASSSEPGLYETVYVPREPGAYEAKAAVVSGTGVEEGKLAAGWASNLGNDEFQSLKPNRSLLQDMARVSGGEIVEAGNLDKFVKGLPNRKAPIVEKTTAPLWHRSVVFLLALLCFIGEWGIRRWKGLA